MDRLSFSGWFCLFFFILGFGMSFMAPILYPVSLLLLGFAIMGIQKIDVTAGLMPVQIGLPGGNYRQYNNQTYHYYHEEKSSLFGWKSFFFIIPALFCATPIWLVGHLTYLACQ
jgi:hypothetical protein